MSFSIVLCTYNGRKRLATTLTHIAALNIASECAVELIIVDNASTDDTAAFVTSYWQELGNPFPLRLIAENRSGKGYAIETGYDAANLAYILTVDDDNWLDKDYLLHALDIFSNNPAIGILQGHSTGAFELEPPAWLKAQEQYFIIGSPVKQLGYFPAGSFFVWGAGMIICKADWDHIRDIGFRFLTSKLPGKAAGEDNETALALLLLGRKIFYSDKLKYQHYMPKERIVWSKLIQNFEVFGYVSYYLFLYELVVDSFEKGYKITKLTALQKLKLLDTPPQITEFTLKQNIYYWLKPMEEWYQLELTRQYSRYKWLIKLLPTIEEDVRTIQRWMLPLLSKNEHYLFGRKITPYSNKIN